MMTWGEFKEKVESEGVTDETFLRIIDYFEYGRTVLIDIDEHDIAEITTI